MLDRANNRLHEYWRRGLPGGSDLHSNSPSTYNSPAWSAHNWQSSMTDVSEVKTDSGSERGQPRSGLFSRARKTAVRLGGWLAVGASLSWGFAALESVYR